MNEEQLFHEALARSHPRERRAFLDAACAGQPELRTAVEALLVAHEQSGSFLNPVAPPLTKLHEEVMSSHPLGVVGGDTENLAAGTEPNSQAADQRPTILPAATVPDRIGRYKIRRVLGQGGMGTVYLAHDPELDRPVALKVPQLSGRDAEERFLREARAAAAVSHPHLCPVYDAGRADGVLYLAMAYVPGPTLTEVLRQGGPLAAARAAAITAAVARGMAEAHRHGIVHRDLKPGNVLLDRRGEPVVTDFGLALRATLPELTASAQATAAHDPRLTQAGVLMGTPAYMPPEQARGALDEVGPGSDVYALGAILFELLTGRPPFQAMSLGDLARRIETESPPLPSAVRAGIPAGLDAVCRRALAKKPAERWPSMEAFAEALGPLATGRRRRHWGWIAAAVAAFAPLLAIAGIVLFVQTNQGTIEIRLSDSQANVQVSVDGEEVRVTDNGRVTRLRAGAHALEVKGDGFETETRQFKLTRGEKVVLEVALRPTAKGAGAEPRDATSPPTTSSAVSDADGIRLAGLLLRGRKLIDQGNFVGLDVVAAEALKIDPESPSALALRATYRAIQGDLEGARGDAEAALKLNPETAQALLIRAGALAEEGQIDEAIADETVAIRLQPDEPRPWANRANSYLNRKDYHQAIADATRAIELGLGGPDALMNRSAAFACLGDYEKALADFDVAAQRAPNDWRVFDQRSALHDKLGHVDQAAADWARAKQLEPTLRLEDRLVFPDPPPKVERKQLTEEESMALKRTQKGFEEAWLHGDMEACRKAADEAERIDPTDATGKSLRARLFGQLGQLEQALAEANGAIRLDPNDAWANTVRGAVRAGRGDTAGAIADYTISLRLDPALYTAWNNRGFAYFKRAQYQQSLADLDQAIRLKTRSDAYANRAASHLSLGQYREALADYARAAELEPANAKWPRIRAAVLAKLGDPDGARQEREQAIKLDPSLGSAADIELPPPPKVKLDPELPLSSAASAADVP